MFPRPIEQRGPVANVTYRFALYIAVALWLIPLAAVIMTSVRSIADINAGNYWGMPDELQLVENYTRCLSRHPWGVTCSTAC